MLRRLIAPILVVLALLGPSAGQMVPGISNPMLLAQAGKVLTFQTSAIDTVTNATKTFTSQAIGTATADRMVIVGVGGHDNTRTISSVTVGGITATQNVVLATGNATSGIFTAAVPTGTTATIVVTWSASQANTGIGVWSATGLASDTASNTASSSADPSSATVTTLAGGFAVGYRYSGDTGTYTWTGGTERFDATVGPGSHTGADTTTTGSNVTFTADDTGTDTNRPMVAASF